MASFAYTDDLVLLAPTVSSLNTMLSICNDFSKEYNILFNASKSKLVIFGETINAKVYFQGQLLPISNTEKHVGNLHVLSNNDIDVETKIIENACNDLYLRTNLRKSVV